MPAGKKTTAPSVLLEPQPKPHRPKSEMALLMASVSAQELEQATATEIFSITICDTVTCRTVVQHVPPYRISRWCIWHLGSESEQLNIARPRSTFLDHLPLRGPYSPTNRNSLPAEVQPFCERWLYLPTSKEHRFAMSNDHSSCCQPCMQAAESVALAWRGLRTAMWSTKPSIRGGEENIEPNTTARGQCFETPLGIVLQSQTQEFSRTRNNKRSNKSGKYRETEFVSRDQLSTNRVRQKSVIDREYEMALLLNNTVAPQPG